MDGVGFEEYYYSFTGLDYFFLSSKTCHRNVQGKNEGTWTLSKGLWSRVKVSRPVKYHQSWGSLRPRIQISVGPKDGDCTSSGLPDFVQFIWDPKVSQSNDGLSPYVRRDLQSGWTSLLTFRNVLVSGRGIGSGWNTWKNPSLSRTSRSSVLRHIVQPIAPNTGCVVVCVYFQVEVRYYHQSKRHKLYLS